MLREAISVSAFSTIGAFLLSAIVATIGRCDEPTITLEALLAEMIDRDALARYPHPKYVSKQWSSYNRQSISPDKPGWFADGDSGHCLRTEQNDGKTEWVLMDQQGPGCLTRVWTPFFYNDFNQRTGPKLNIYLDGSSTPVVSEEMLGLIMGKSFVKLPLAYESVRAGDMYLPIAFAQGCKITTDAKPFYYIINSRAYALGTNVDSFTQAKYQAAMSAISQTGNALLHPTATQSGKTVVGEGAIQPGANLVMSLPSGSNALRSLQIQLPVGQPEALRSTILQITFDGQQTVRVPVGDMFSSSVRLNAFEDFARTVDKDGTMTCRWVMPYKSSAQVTLANTGKTVVAAQIEATVGDWQWDDRSMYFHVDWREERGIPTNPIRDWNYVTIKGKGVYVGDSLTVHNPVAGWWGEGDEKVYVDGETFPSHFGTGTEDYYGYAGGVLPDVSTDIYSRPFHGQMQVACKEPGYNVLSRIRSLDAIPFEKQLKFDMEISHTPELRQPSILVDYAVVTFWYGLPGTVSVNAADLAQAEWPVATLRPDGSPNRAVWMAQGSYGVMTHYLITPKGNTPAEKTADLNRIASQFDVDHFVRQFQATGADWLIFTIGQDTGYFCSPNAYLDAREPGLTPRRDVVMEIAQRLQPLGKRLILYLPSESDSVMLPKSFGFGAEGYADRYFEFLRQYSLKFGKLHHGWWFDSCGPHPDEYWNKWMAAARAGNPEAVIAFSGAEFCCGRPINPICKLEDYHAGEIHLLENGQIRRDFLPPGGDIIVTADGKLRKRGQEACFYLPDAPLIDGVQWHGLLPIDLTFNPAVPNQFCHYTDAELFEFVRRIKKVGGAVTINVPIAIENGHIPADTHSQLVRMAKSLGFLELSTGPERR